MRDESTYSVLMHRGRSFVCRADRRAIYRYLGHPSIYQFKARREGAYTVSEWVCRMCKREVTFSTRQSRRQSRCKPLPFAFHGPGCAKLWETITAAYAEVSRGA